jgi:hypothetical protein
MAHTHRYQVEFVIRQYYMAYMDESKLDAHKQEWETRAPELIESHFTRLHRMFHAIMNSQEAMRKVLEYRILREHEALYDGMGEHIETRFGSDIDFPTLLLSVADCFTPDDKAWLAQLVKDIEAAREDGPDSGEPYELDDLEDCFEVEPKGWNMGPHDHAHKGS